jgi:hypothetical protein
MFHELLVQYHIRPGIQNTVFISDVSFVHKLQHFFLRLLLLLLRWCLCDSNFLLDLRILDVSQVANCIFVECTRMKETVSDLNRSSQGLKFDLF